MCQGTQAAASDHQDQGAQGGCEVMGTRVRGVVSVWNSTPIDFFECIIALLLKQFYFDLQRIVEAIFLSLPMLGDVLVLTLFYFAIVGIICVELFKGRLLNRCGYPVFTYANTDGSSSDLLYVSSNVNNVSHPQSGPYAYGAVLLYLIPHLLFCIQNVTYAINTSSYFLTQQVCGTPLASMESWSNSSDGPLTSQYSQPPYQWTYMCPWYPSDNPNDMNYPNGLICVEYMNPSIGGLRNFDNILFAWLAILQHIICQDWWVGSHQVHLSCSSLCVY